MEPDDLSGDADLRVLVLCYRLLAAGSGLACLMAAANQLAIPLSFFTNAISVFLSAAVSWSPIRPAPLSVLVVALVQTALLLFVGRSLEKRQNRTFVLVAAWITAGYFPLGTVLGVATIWKLVKTRW